MHIPTNVWKIIKTIASIWWKYAQSHYNTISCKITLMFLIHFQSTFHGKNLDDNIQTDILYLDFAKEVDSVDHVTLLEKLERYGCSWTSTWLAQELSARSAATSSCWLIYLQLGLCNLRSAQRKFDRPITLHHFINALPSGLTWWFFDSPSCRRHQAVWKYVIISRCP